MFCQHRGCCAVDASPGQAQQHQQTLQGHQAQWRQLLFCRCSSTNESRGFLWLLSFHSVANQGAKHWEEGMSQSAPGLDSTQPWPLMRLAVSPAHPQGGPEPLHQQLLLHFPSSQAHFLSLVHRDYSNCNQNREEKAPQNARGTKLYKG